MRHAAHTRPEPPASGTLESRPVVHLLVYARELELSGTFELTEASGRAQGLVVLHKGRVTKARVDQAAAFFGTVAYELGMIDRAKLDKSLAVLAKGGKRHGDVLVEQGVLSRAQVDIVLAEQTFRKIAHLHSLPDTTRFAFYHGYDGLKGWPTDGPKVDPLPGVWRGVRDCAPAAHVKTVLDRLGTARWRLRNGSPIMSFAFDSAAVTLLERLRNPMKIPEFITRAGAARELAQRLAYVLAITKCLEPGDAHGVPPPSRPPVHSSGTYARLSFEMRTPYYRASGPPSAPSSNPIPAAPSSAPSSGRSPSPAPAQPTSKKPQTLLAPPPISHRPAPTSQNPAPVAQKPGPLSSKPAGPPTEALTRQPSSPLDAAKVYREAEAALEAQQLKLAEELCRRAYELAPEVGRYAAMLVWIDAQRAVDAPPEHVKPLTLKLDRIIGDDPHCEEALFYRATLLKRIGNDEAALRDFNRIVALNPGHIDAARELRLAELRKKKR